MAKYIIDIPEKGKAYYTVSDLTPYTASESYIEGLKNGQDEVWEFVRCIMGMNANKYRECFDIDDIAEDDFTCKYTYQEARKVYEEWRNQDG